MTWKDVNVSRLCPSSRRNRDLTRSDRAQPFQLEETDDLGARFEVYLPVVAEPGSGHVAYPDLFPLFELSLRSFSCLSHQPVPHKLFLYQR